MKKFNALFNLKSILIFTLTVFFGLWSAGFFDRYVFRFGFVESFSDAEVRAVMGKRVRNVCQPLPYSERPGAINGFMSDVFGNTSILVAWDNMDAEKTGKLFPTGFNKTAYKQCLRPALAE